MGPVPTARNKGTCLQLESSRNPARGASWNLQIPPPLSSGATPQKHECLRPKVLAPETSLPKLLAPFLGCQADVDLRMEELPQAPESQAWGLPDTDGGMPLGPKPSTHCKKGPFYHPDGLQFQFLLGLRALGSSAPRISEVWVANRKYV